MTHYMHNVTLIWYVTYSDSSARFGLPIGGEMLAVSTKRFVLGKVANRKMLLAERGNYVHNKAKAVKLSGWNY